MKEKVHWEKGGGTLLRTIEAMLQDARASRAAANKGGHEESYWQGVLDACQSLATAVREGKVT